MWLRIKSFIIQQIIKIGILLVFVILIHNFIVRFYSDRSREQRVAFVEDKKIIENRLTEVLTHVNLFDLGLRGYYMITEPKFKQPYVQAIDIYQENLNQLKSALQKHGYKELEKVDYLSDLVDQYGLLVKEAVDHIDNGEPERVIDLFSNDPGYDLYLEFTVIQNSIQDFMAEADALSEEEFDFVMAYALFAQLLLLVVGLPVLIFVVLRMRRNERKIRRLFEALDDGNREYIYYEQSDHQDGKVNENVVIDRLVSNLRKATEFIKQVTQNNLDVEWEGMTEEKLVANKETLAGELLTMRDQMKNVKEEERQRFWVTDGISKFSEIVRSNQDNLQKLGEALISEVVKYVKANQGGLFILNNEKEDDPHLQLVSCYAYERQKYLEKRIEIGKGLLGQTFLEGETLQLQEIPADYISITSGLGESLPKYVLLVPLRLNENIQGVLELAAFDEFPEYYIEFLEKLGEIIATAIINTNTATKTKQLLETTQQNQEELRSQEEEMRQNMEELQATQEEMQRKEQEYLDRISQLESELSDSER